MIYSKSAADGYTKVEAGACQIQSKIVNVTLGVIHNNVAPSPLDIPDFTIYGDTEVHVTLGTDDCYVKVLSHDTVDFGATEI